MKDIDDKLKALEEMVAMAYLTYPTIHGFEEILDRIHEIRNEVQTASPKVQAHLRQQWYPALGRHQTVQVDTHRKE